VHFYRFLPGTNYLIKTLLPGSRGARGRDTRVDRLASYYYSMRASASVNLDLMWGSAMAHHAPYSASNFSYSVRVASCMQLSPPKATPSAAGRL
jgi:hypothetical protein